MRIKNPRGGPIGPPPAVADPGFGNGGYANLKMMDLYAGSPSDNGVMVDRERQWRDCILERYRDMPHAKFRKKWRLWVHSDGT